MRKIFSLFQETIKNCNVFTSPVNLRYDLDPDYNTFAGGCVSIGLIVLLMSVFFNSWLLLLNKEAISSSTETIRQFDPQYIKVNSDDFMFAVGVNNVNLSDITQKKYFDFKISKNSIINGTKVKTNLVLQTCNQKHWQQLGQDFVQTFKRQQLSTFLCMPRNYSIQISGKYTSQKFIYYKISLEKCTGTNCRNQSEIDSFILANTAFSFNFYYANTLINPDQKQPLSTFFQDKDYFMFSSTLGTSANLYLGEYIMNTDESIYPWTQQHIQEGFIVSRAQKQTWDYMITPSQSYCKLYLRKSNIRIEIQRKFRKLDDMLSYIGGLFGIFAVVCGFIMNYYGQCSFQLQMAQKIFDYSDRKSKKSSQNQQKNYRVNEDISINSVINHAQQELKQEQRLKQSIIQPKDFGFLDFLLHFIYKIVKKVCNCQWRRMKVYEESIQEMRYKLDVSQLLQKLSFYDRSFTTLFDQNQLKLLYLQQKINFDDVRQERDLLGMRKDIIANLFGMIAQNNGIKQNKNSGQQKKTIKQIALQKSRKRLKTFMGKQIHNVFDILGQNTFKPQENKDQINLPPDIRKALKNLQQKIQAGDPISIRIYNGLQYQLLQAYEKSKSKSKARTGFISTGKKLSKKIKIKQQYLKNQKIRIDEASPNDSVRSIQNFF